MQRCEEPPHLHSAFPLRFQRVLGMGMGMVRDVSYDTWPQERGTVDRWVGLSACI